MSFFANYFQRLLVCSRHPRASYYLAGTSFVEASFFPIAPDILLIPMILAKKDEAWNYAILTTFASVLGGIFGYFLGHFFAAWVEPHLMIWGYASLYVKVKIWYEQWGVWALLLAGVTPVPFKLFTLTSGMMDMSFIPFVIAASMGRAIRFFSVSAAVYYYGDRAVNWMSIYGAKCGWSVIIILCLGTFLLNI